jgi:hypothetical protein
VFEQVVELGLEARVGLGTVIFRFEVEDQRHQRFGDIATTELAKVAAFVGLVAEAVLERALGGHGSAAWQRARRLSRFERA